MARITTVEKARKEQGSCYTCHQTIDAGTSYRWTKPSRYSMRYAWHSTCAMPPGSALETNDKRATAMAAFEDLYANLDGIEVTDETTPDDLESEVSDFITQAADQVNEAAEMWRESAQAIEDGFGHPTYQSEEMTERADEYEGVASDLENIDTTPDEDLTEYVDRIRDEVSSTEGNLT